MSTSLNKLYDELNKQFFGGKLPRFRVVLSPSLRQIGACSEARRLIRLRPGLAPTELRRRLLHEMCHVGTPGDHGKPFLKKLRHLLKRGEEWAQEEIDFYRLNPLASYTEEMIKGEFEDWTYLIGDLETLAWTVPRPRFDWVVSELAPSVSLSPADLLLRVPWLKKEWRNACRRHDRKIRAKKPGGEPSANPT